MHMADAWTKVTDRLEKKPLKHNGHRLEDEKYGIRRKGWDNLCVVYGLDNLPCVNSRYGRKFTFSMADLYAKDWEICSAKKIRRG